ncbi:hypothetical protein BHE97_14650 [Aeromicrobium sp. PE09-221]|uniref:GNAT family N-acetyltransferase n=1 Tax=Aeromicrobium sp. PE09-221 TaxID=1898043 RepID=UPI000B63B921|nr:GNAT family N-acetyltransferase [Aeromicrobium sp. PE09-221]OUZ07940.1 hypothetical protein BHE97_14650 [Aeromicrobium sp. PE09-221]
MTLRDATVDDARSLVELWTACAEAGQGDGPEAFTQQMLWRRPDEAEAAEAMAYNFEHRARRMIVALDDDRVIGVVVGDLATVSPISRAGMLIVTDVHVHPEYRRRSVARLLLSAMAAHAEENGCEIVVASVPVQARETNRYFTKVGFNQLAVLRAVQTSRLRARLDDKIAHARGNGRLLAVRRTLRRRQEAALN